MQINQLSHFLNFIFVSFILIVSKPERGGAWCWTVEQWKKLWYGRTLHKLIGRASVDPPKKDLNPDPDPNL